MDWDKLRIFHSVADAGSFTKAGEDLGLSQSAVSRQISAFEETLKTPLFHRHARGLILTEQGEMLYRVAHDINNRLKSARTMLMDSREKPYGPLRITTTIGLGSIWLTARIGEFINLYPDIEVQILLDNNELDLSMGAADVAIRFRRPSQADLIQRKLFTVHHHIYASPDYLRGNGTPTSIDDLDNHKIITFGEAPSYMMSTKWLETIGRKDSNPRKPVLRINSVYGLRRATQTGLGIASLPDYIIADDSKLIQLDIGAEPPEYDVHFVYPEELKSSKRVAVFRDFIVEKAKAWSF